MSQQARPSSLARTITSLVAVHVACGLFLLLLWAVRP